MSFRTGDIVKLRYATKGFVSPGFSVSETEQIAKLGGMDVKSGDEGVVVSTEGGIIHVKLVPIFPDGGQGMMATRGEIKLIQEQAHLVTPYRFVKLDQAEAIRCLARVEVESLIERVTKCGKKRKAEVLALEVTRREAYRNHDITELFIRLGRFGALVDRRVTPSSTATLSLIDEGFLTEEEAERIAQSLAAKLKLMEYPWDLVNSKAHRTLLTHGTVDQAALKVAEASFSTHHQGVGLPAPMPGETPGERASFRQVLRSIAIWARSRRKLIRVSAASQRTLFELAVERVMYGLPVAIWNYLPCVGASEIFHGEGIMFQWEREAVDPEDDSRRAVVADIITFGAPKGAYEDAGQLDFNLWRLLPTSHEHVSSDWIDKGYATVWANAPFIPTDLTEAEIHRILASPNIRDEDMPSTLVEGMSFDWRIRQSVREKQREGLSHEAAVRDVLGRGQYVFVHMSVNLIAALHNFSASVVRRSEAPSSKKKGRRTKSNMSVRQVNLDETGLYTWSTTWAREQAQRELCAAGREGVVVGLHKRSGTEAFTWIREESLIPGEKVYETKKGTTKKDGEVLYVKVKRSRAGGWVGHGPLKPKTMRVRQGVDDMDVFRNNAALNNLRDLLD